MMRTVFSVCLGLTVCVTSLAAQQQHYQRQPGLEVAHYVFGITLTDANDDVAGETTVTARFTRAGMASFFLDLSSVADRRA